MDQATLNEILRKHRLWLKDDPNGKRAVLENANLICADLRYADLRYANLRHANLKGANLICAVLENANLICADLRHADLSHANLEDADLKCADLKDANLICANLRCADLRHADLRYANLRRANLEGAVLKHANLEGSDLRTANLEGAYLRTANLEGAVLTQTISQNIEGQKVISIQVDTSRVNNTISYWKDLGVWTTGCFQGNLEELQERVAETHEDNPFLRKRYERAIAFILSEAEHDDKKADQRQLIDYILKYTN
ncbi:pentapeptide repeat-containing protein [Aerococcus christensenii]|uniref:pentapeptide repeat-containing protein n=1 Tax=Aerococcus christensenii TaxID=87541 RepID=UPI0023A9EAB6|nr:pentapeptide repeat-containing protein [Aerococcus christensenii]WEB70568.1 pentapeptide repeat-containing protein [Aerococcus christensenii]